MATGEIQTSIYSLSPQELSDKLTQLSFSCEQISRFHKQYFCCRNFKLAEFTGIVQSLVKGCVEYFDWELPRIINSIESDDGTTKLLLRTKKGNTVESVVMRYSNRTVLCLSSQVGCKLACAFCQTGKLGFMANLSTDEIIGQFAVANVLVREEGRRITNVVFMGMGEPLDNYQAVVKSVQILTEGFALSRRRVTISTAGLPEKIKRLAHEVSTPLAISLHACRDDLRTELMPINKRFPLAALKDALVYYQQVTQTKITVEYLLIKDKNCGLREAQELLDFLRDLPCKINLIPFNHHPGMPYEKPTAEEIWLFQKFLLDNGALATVRYSRGSAVSAACGQLARKEIENLNAVPQKISLQQRVAY